VKVERCAANPEWAALRRQLWPNSQDAELLTTLERGAAFLIRDDTGRAIGFAEAALRHDYVNGCNTSPVVFLEGIFVCPEHRRQGAARLLCRAVANWAKAAGVTEFASDVPLDNPDSQQMHIALGFTETERVIYYRKML